MIEIKGVGFGGALPPEEIERERLKEIKTRAGRTAFIMSAGEQARVIHVAPGITKSEGALKWIDEEFNKEKWKNS